MPKDPFIDVPELAVDALPIDQQEAGKGIRDNLRSISDLPMQFEAALNLLHFAPAAQRHTMTEMAAPTAIPSVSDDLYERLLHLSMWQHFAVRVAALLVYDYRQFAQAIDALLAKCPAWKTKVDEAAKKESNRLFDATFPDWADIRDRAAHTPLASNYPANLAENLVRDGSQPAGFEMGGAWFGHSNISGNKISFSINGRKVEQELSPTSAAIFRRIVNLRMQSFAPLSTAS